MGDVEEISKDLQGVDDDFGVDWTKVEDKKPLNQKIKMRFYLLKRIKRMLC